ncbi:MAG: regulatory protein RecX [Spirochaetaceae bacterium]|nr:MAG: regulatory protein RecX [Spirochaetaceae bacterium]
MSELQLPVVVDVQKGTFAGWQKVTLSDGSFFCALSALLREEACDVPGAVISVIQGSLLEQQSWHIYVRQKAMASLARAEQSRFHLQQKLLAKGCPRDAVDTVLGDLQQKNLLSDERFALAWARNRMEKKGESARQVIIGLRQRGISQCTAESSVKQIIQDDPGLPQKALERAADKILLKCDDYQLASLKLRRLGFPADKIVEFFEEISR